ncbi:MAG: alpha-L-glutamate ligase [Pseudomonadota bacterium]
MRKVYVLHENNEWTEHLEVRLQQLDIPYELWHLDQGLIDLSQAPPHGVFYNRISASSHTRDHRYAPEMTEAVLAWLERHNRTVVNGSRALRLELSKVNQYTALERAGIRTPKTVAAVGTEHILSAARTLNVPSFITKHNRAGKGLGVKRFDSINALEAHLDSDAFEPSIDGITLVQAYIDSPQRSIIRHEFIGGQFFYAVRVDTSSGFELCPADHCAVDPLTGAAKTQTAATPMFDILRDYRPDFIDAYEAFLAENQVLVAGIEAIEDHTGRVFTYDVNTNTNYNSDAEAKVGQFAMLQMARYLGNLLNRSEPLNSVHTAQSPCALA